MRRPGIGDQVLCEDEEGYSFSETILDITTCGEYVYVRHPEDSLMILKFHKDEVEFISPDKNPKDLMGSKKAPMAYVPSNVMAEVGVAMLEGSLKYGAYNYRNIAIQASEYYNAGRRHDEAWWNGEDYDPDTDCSKDGDDHMYAIHHIAKSIATRIVLLDAIMNGKLIDNRPPSPEPFYPRLNELTARLIEKHKDKSPRHYTINDSKADIS